MRFPHGSRKREWLNEEFWCVIGATNCAPFIEARSFEVRLVLPTVISFTAINEEGATRRTITEGLVEASKDEMSFPLP